MEAKVTIVGADEALEKVNRYIELLHEANDLARELATAEIEMNLHMISPEQQADF